MDDRERALAWIRSFWGAANKAIEYQPEDGALAFRSDHIEVLEAAWAAVEQLPESVEVAGRIVFLSAPVKFLESCLSFHGRFVGTSTDVPAKSTVMMYAGMSVSVWNELRLVDFRRQQRYSDPNLARLRDALELHGHDADPGMLKAYVPMNNSEFYRCLRKLKSTGEYTGPYTPRPVRRKS